MFKNMNDRIFITALSNIDIFNLFALNPDREFYVREVAAKTKTSLGKTSSLLRTLQERGVLTKRTQGKNVLYQINENSVVKQLKILINVASVFQLLSGIFDNCNKVILYGSLAKGTNTFESDIDLIITTSQKDKLNTALEKVKNPLLSAHVMNETEFIELKRKNPGLMKKIDEGIVIWERT